MNVFDLHLPSVVANSLFAACENNDTHSLNKLIIEHQLTNNLFFYRKKKTIVLPECTTFRGVYSAGSDGGPRDSGSSPEVVRAVPVYKPESVVIFETLLSKAVESLSVEIVSLLLICGMPANHVIKLDRFEDFSRNMNDPRYHRAAVTGSSPCETTEPGCGCCTTVEPIETNVELHTPLTLAIIASLGFRKTQAHKEDIIHLLLDFGADVMHQVQCFSGNALKNLAVTKRACSLNSGVQFKMALHLAIEKNLSLGLITRIAQLAGYSQTKDSEFKALYKNPVYTPPWQENCLLDACCALLILPVIVAEFFRRFPEIYLTPLTLAKLLKKEYTGQVTTTFYDNVIESLSIIHFDPTVVQRISLPLGFVYMLVEELPEQVPQQAPLVNHMMPQENGVAPAPRAHIPEPALALPLNAAPPAGVLRRGGAGFFDLPAVNLQGADVASSEASSSRSSYSSNDSGDSLSTNSRMLHSLGGSESD